MPYKHGMCGTPTHGTWVRMRNRVSQKEARRGAYKDVKICDRWDTFEGFIEDMGLQPEGYSLDRIDPKGDYEPSNCRWLPLKDQSDNRSNVVQYTYDGKTMNLRRWSKEVGLEYLTLYQRVHKLGWSIERALSTKKVIGRPKCQDSTCG